MTVFKFHQADLSLDTLRAIKSDLFKYAHLKAYEKDFKELQEVIKAREIAERKEVAEERRASVSRAS